ncbi:hypothetical protein SAMN05216278_3380 [Halopelagius longus]|uniref:Uncharacterized protein n=1 Tax=Halopelagius longus TaxID=1236180 RepID=A0A1H1FS59_9EURY|nr:hypothetical protein SAMN05216278_3380 [Halopelagius longus]
MRGAKPKESFAGAPVTESGGDSERLILDSGRITMRTHRSVGLRCRHTLLRDGV